MKAPVMLGICCLLVNVTTWASAHPIKGSWFGDMQLGGGFVSARPSGLEVLDDDERLDSLASRGRRQSQAFPLIGGEIGFRFDRTGTTLSAGAGMETPLHLSLHQDGGAVGELTLSALYENEDVWENPYLEGENRSRTDAESVGFSLKWDRVLASGANLYFERMRIDVEQDLIGRIQPDLRRDGTDTTLGIGYSWDWGAAGVLSPSLRHIWVDREGAGNSGCGYMAGLKHVLGLGRFSFATRLDVGRIDFHKVHPLFDKKRGETAYGLSETLSFAEPFGFDRWYLFGAAAYSATHSNITFFDSSSVVIGTGIGYRF